MYRFIKLLPLIMAVHSAPTAAAIEIPLLPGIGIGRPLSLPFCPSGKNAVVRKTCRVPSESNSRRLEQRVDIRIPSTDMPPYMARGIQATAVTGNDIVMKVEVNTSGLRGEADVLETLTRAFGNPFWKVELLRVSQGGTPFETTRADWRNGSLIYSYRGTSPALINGVLTIEGVHAFSWPREERFVPFTRRDAEVAKANDEKERELLILTSLALRGDVEIQRTLAKQWESGDKDAVAKAGYMFALCEKTYVECTLGLAALKRAGKGMEKDLAIAESLFKKAISIPGATRLNVAAAQTGLATIYLEGRPGTDRINEAESLLRPLAERGYASAQFWMGALISKKFETPTPDQLVEAAKWLIAFESNAGEASRESDAAFAMRRLTLDERERAKNEAAALPRFCPDAADC